MKRWFHDSWPVLAVLLFATFLAVQIPVASLRTAVPQTVAVAPAASFVTFDEAAYARVVRRLRMAWQVGARTTPGGHADSRIDVFDFSDPLPPPSFLPAPPVPQAAAPVWPAWHAPALLPPSLAEPMPPFSVPSGPPDRDGDLLAWPDWCG